jgi:nucleoid-associated protein YgaU
MLIPVLVIGGAGAVIAIAALMARSRAPVQPPVKQDPVPGEEEQEKKRVADDPEEDNGGGRSEWEDLGKKVTGIIGTFLEREDPVKPPAPPEPPKPTEPDPFSPSPAPVAGRYYQVVQGDTLWEMARAAYADGPQYPKIVADPRNQWIGVHGDDWGGGLYPKYSGWNTAWKSGYEYPVVYIPELAF